MQRAYTWHQDKQIYFAFFAKLLTTGERDQAMKLLKRQFAMMPLERLTSYLQDEEVYDADLHSFYKQALVEQDKVSKELKVVRGITSQTYLRRAEELLSL